MSNIEYKLYCWMDDYNNIEPQYESWMEEDGGWFPVYRKLYCGDPKDYGKESNED